MTAKLCHEKTIATLEAGSIACLYVTISTKFTLGNPILHSGVGLRHRCASMWRGCWNAEIETYLCRPQCMPLFVLPMTVVHFEA